MDDWSKPTAAACECPFFQRKVSPSVVAQADGERRIVNCLDKDQACFEHACAFTTDGGDWPFGQVRLEPTPPA